MTFLSHGTLRSIMFPRMRYLNKILPLPLLAELKEHFGVSEAEVKEIKGNTAVCLERWRKERERRGRGEEGGLRERVEGGRRERRREREVGC